MAFHPKTLRAINIENLSKSADGGLWHSCCRRVRCKELKIIRFLEDEQVSAAIVSAVKEAAEDSPFLDPEQALGENCAHLV